MSTKHIVNTTDIYSRLARTPPVTWTKNIRTQKLNHEDEKTNKQIHTYGVQHIFGTKIREDHTWLLMASL
jgi:hypothetical protein